jgi:hypothetical protein
VQAGRCCLCANFHAPLQRFRTGCPAFTLPLVAAAPETAILERKRNGNTLLFRPASTSVRIFALTIDGN